MENVHIIPVNIFLMVSGLSPNGESLPPSRLKPKPAPSFVSMMVSGGPRSSPGNRNTTLEAPHQMHSYIPN